MASCALGMGCKESMVSAPLMVFAYDYLFVTKKWSGALKKHRTLYTGLALSWLVLLSVTIGAPRSMSVGFNLSVTAMDYLQTQAHVLVHYLRLCFWPSPLTVVYDWPIEHSFVHAIPPGLLIIALLAFTVWLLARRHWLAAPWTLFFLVLGPTSSFIPIVSEVAAERRMHLPLLAAVLSVVALIDLLASRRSTSLSERRLIALSIALSLMAAVPLAIVTADRLTDYRDNLTLWQAAVRDVPHSQGAEHNLGVAYKKLGRIDEAIVHFRRAIEINPKFSLPYGSIASIYHDRGEVTRAAVDYEAALRCDPNYRFALQNLTAIYLDQGRPDLAKPLIDRLLTQAPNSPGVHNSLGLYLAQKSQFPAAIAAFNVELQIDPLNFDALHNLGMSLIDAGRPDEALAVFETFIKKSQGLDPSQTTPAARKHVATLLPDVHRAMAHLLTQAGRTAEAAEHLKSAGPAK
jgi:tetratricopeptide (TPR) repeat protein